MKQLAPELSRTGSCASILLVADIFAARVVLPVGAADGGCSAVVSLNAMRRGGAAPDG